MLSTQKAEATVAAVVSQLRDARVAQGLSFKKLEELSGITHQGIHFIESGERMPSLLTLLRIAEPLGVDLGEALLSALHSSEGS